MSVTTWTQTVDDDFDFTAVEVFDDIDIALRERGKVVRELVVIHTPQVDDDVQLSALWSDRQFRTFGVLSEGFPFFVGDVFLRWVDTEHGDQAGSDALKRIGASTICQRLGYA